MVSSGSRAGSVHDVPGTGKLSKLLSACQKSQERTWRVTDQKWEIQSINKVSNCNRLKYIS